MIFIGASTGRHHHAVTPFYNGMLPICSYSFVTKRVGRKVPLLPRRGARLKGAWVRAAHERFASAPLRIQERTDWPLPAANTLRLEGAEFLFSVAYFHSFVGADARHRPVQPCGTTKLHGLCFYLWLDVGGGVPNAPWLCTWLQHKWVDAYLL